MSEESIETRVAVLDTKVTALLRDLGGLDRLFTSLQDTSDLEQKIAILETEVEVIHSKLEKKIEKTEFQPVKAIVYGFSGMILLVVLTSILLSIGLKAK